MVPYVAHVVQGSGDHVFLDEAGVGIQRIWVSVLDIAQTGLEWVLVVVLPHDSLLSQLRSWQTTGMSRPVSRCPVHAVTLSTHSRTHTHTHSLSSRCRRGCDHMVCGHESCEETKTQSQGRHVTSVSRTLPPSPPVSTSTPLTPLITPPCVALSRLLSADGAYHDSVAAMSDPSDSLNRKRLLKS